MGMLKRLKDQVQAATEMAQQVKDAMPESRSMMGSGGPTGAEQVTILNPTDQAEIDRLWAGGGPVRGVVMGAYDDMEGGSRAVRTRAQVRVRARLAGGGLGEERKINAWVGWKVAVLLDPGLEIPIEVDRASGVPTSIVTKQLTDELAPRFAESRKRHSAGTFDTGPEGITQAPAALREAFSPTPPPQALPAHDADDPRYAPINGVTWEQLITVMAQISVKAPPGGLEEAALGAGVPAGVFATVHMPWVQRMSRDPALPQRFAVELDLASRALRGT